jgi:hypothetical protein
LVKQIAFFSEFSFLTCEMGKLITDGKTDEWYRGTAQLGHGVLWSSLTPGLHQDTTGEKQ